MTNTQSPAPGVVAIEPKKLQPGTPEHFAFLGVPYGWNFLKGKDYADMQGFAKAVWDAALKNAWAAERRHDEFDLMLSTLRYIVGAEPAAAGMTARDHYNAVIKALGSWPSQPEQAAKRIDAMLAKFPLYPRPAPAPQAAGANPCQHDPVPKVHCFACPEKADASCERNCMTVQASVRDVS